MPTILNNNIIQLDIKNKFELECEENLGGIILPFGVGRNAITKTITCKIKNISSSAIEKYNINVGDEVLVDRYAIIKVTDKLDPNKINAYINTDSIIMVKRIEGTSSNTFSTPKEKVLHYLNIAPKKCYFSVFNTMKNNECTLIAMKHSKLITRIVNAYSERLPNEVNNFEAFCHRIINDPKY